MNPELIFFVGIVSIVVGIAAVVTAGILILRGSKRKKRMNAVVDAVSVGNVMVCEYETATGKLKWYGNVRREMHPDDQKDICLRIEKIRGNDPDIRSFAPFVVRLKEKDGEYRFWMWQPGTLADRTEKHFRLPGVLTDVDELIRKGTRLEKEKDLYAEAVRLKTERYYKIALVNVDTGMCRYLKYREEELDYLGDDRSEELRNNKIIDYNWWVQVTMDKLIHPDYREEFKETFALDKLREAVMDGIDHQSMIYQRKDTGSGEYRYVEADFIAVPVRIPDNEISGDRYTFEDLTEIEKGGGIMIYIRDINEEHLEQQKHREELERALHEAEAANQTKSDFIEYMTRDLNAQIRAIGAIDKMASQALESGNTDRAKTYMIRLERISSDLMLTFEDIFNVSRLPNIERTMKIEETDLKAVAEDCEVYMNYLRRGENLSYMRAGTLEGHYFCDERWLRKCLFKVMENAAKYNVKGGSISINIDKRTLSEDEGTDEFTIVVGDTGVGMTKEQKEHLFEPFNMKKRQPSDISSGSGIGLAIAHGIMKAMQGSIEVESEKGKGTTVTLRFPLKKVQKDGWQYENNYLR